MKQAFYTKNGVVCHNVPEPSLSSNNVLVDVKYSCISAGTEMSAVNNARKSLVKRALESPAKLVPAGLDILRNRGFKALQMVASGATGGEFGKPLGYTAAGIVRSVGNNCTGFKAGDRVAIAGAGLANHAGVVSVPQNLTTLIPESVSFEEASTVAVGCIAMQGVRRIEAIAGETIVVMGLGILGMLGFQMLKCQGCTVIGIDINQQRLDEALQLGCDYIINSSVTDPVQQVQVFTQGKGVDGVLFTAATTSDEPMSACFNMLRRKGRFVLVGVSGMNIRREDIYSKEIDFRMATSYGAGRYDSDYEINCFDYPEEWVRWTENRNMKSYLSLIEKKKINVKILIDDVYNIENVGEAYKSLSKPERPLIVLLQYDKVEAEPAKYYIDKEKVRKKSSGAINYAIIGAGSFARSMHLPNLESMQDKFHLQAVMSRTGSNAALLANLYGASYYTTDLDQVLNDPNIQLVMICTRHDLHADLAIKAMEKGKAVFVEKPAAVEQKELDNLLHTIKSTGLPYMVGFNRRFSSYADAIRDALKSRTNRLQILYTMNAGYLPLDMWVHGKSGGGRIVGEGCHIIDMITSIVNSKIVNYDVSCIKDEGGYYSCSDNITLFLEFEDGSSATMIYNANGSKKYPKETMRIWCGDSYIFLNDYKELIAQGISVRHLKNSAPSKGHKQEMIAFYNAIKHGNGYPISVDEIEQTTQITLQVRDMLMEKAAEMNRC